MVNTALVNGAATAGNTTNENQIIEAENSDFFDVLACVAPAAVPVSRDARADAAKAACAVEFSDKQQGCVDFVLAQYVNQGVDELDADKLSQLLKLKYKNALADAFADLGRPDQVRQVLVSLAGDELVVMPATR